MQDIEDRISNIEKKHSKQGVELNNMDKEIKEIKTDIMRLENKVWSAIDSLRSDLTKSMIKQGWLMGGAVVISALIPWGLALIRIFK